ncbi:MAG: ATP-binding cassette domain-containing protein [Clostridiales bacterium]|nr:MAG: ATP-binding cassette domain-containing protein [Clostridiales bacterium]
MGKNGCGKTTLLNIISGGTSFEGSCQTAKDTRIGFLRQTGCEVMTTTIIEEMTSVFADVFEIEKDLRRLENEIADEQDDAKFLLNSYAKKERKCLKKKDGFLIKTKKSTPF